MWDRSGSLPPPVPPKDSPQLRASQHDNTADGSLSASKRKRVSELEHNYDDYAIDDHTPKRTRVSPIADDLPDLVRTPENSLLRRKKGVSNLSSLGLRHQALQQEKEMEEMQADTSRSSKFQEGSLTDKPSRKPPSTYMRDVDADMASFERLDSMAADYHDSEISVTDYDAPATKYVYPQPRPADNQVSEGGILYRFGQKIANTFRPGPVWSKIWNETKEELTLKNMEAAERKRMQKEQAEAKYATMKRNGQIPTKRSSFAHLGSFSARDSGIGFGKHEHNASRFSLQPSIEASTLDSGQDELDDIAHARGDSTLRGRLHFKRPSLSNIRSDLKRARSELNLGQLIAREPSRSQSPTKQDRHEDRLVRSQSKADLKKHQKLSKRVSDLETKLQTAREELDEALAQASPMPRLGNRYGRYTPSTMRRSHFVPGGLPSLPSESLFDSSLMGTSNVSSMQQSTISESPNDTVLTEHAFLDKDDHEQTIKASRPRVYPTLASNIFEAKLVAHADDDVEHSTQLDKDAEHATCLDVQIEGSTGDVSLAHHADLMREASDDRNTDVHLSDVTPVKPKDTIDSPQTTSSKKARAKKRKVRHEDAAYKPIDEDDPESGGGKRSKKQKSTNDVRMPVASKKTRGAAAAAAAAVAAAKDTADQDQDELGHVVTQAKDEHDAEYDLDDESDGRDHNEHTRRSLDSSLHSLEPVYEEDEEPVMIAVNDAPLKPTATATPARFSHLARAQSPVKRQTAVKAGAEEVIIRRAADAVKKHPGRRVTTTQNDHDDGFEWPEDVF